MVFSKWTIHSTFILSFVPSLESSTFVYLNFNFLTAGIDSFWPLTSFSLWQYRNINNSHEF